MTHPRLRVRDCYFYLLRWSVLYDVAAAVYYDVVWTLVEVGLREPTRKMMMYDLICLVQMQVPMLEENVRMHHVVPVVDLLHLEREGMARQMYPRMDEVHDYGLALVHQWLHLTVQELQISDAKESVRSQSTDEVLLEVVPS